MVKRKAKRKEKILVKPSDLPKDERAQLRINKLIKKRLVQVDKVVLQDLFDKAINEAYGPVEPEIIVAAFSKSETKKKSKK